MSRRRFNKREWEVKQKEQKLINKTVKAIKHQLQKSGKILS